MAGRITNHHGTIALLTSLATDHGFSPQGTIIFNLESQSSHIPKRREFLRSWWDCHFDVMLSAKQPTVLK
jgi:hypothetical protein